MSKRKSRSAWNPKNNVSREHLDELTAKSRKMNPNDPLFDSDVKDKEAVKSLY
jgi:hypothetical protein